MSACGAAGPTVRRATPKPGPEDATPKEFDSGRNRNLRFYTWRSLRDTVNRGGGSLRCEVLGYEQVHVAYSKKRGNYGAILLDPQYTPEAGLLLDFSTMALYGGRAVLLRFSGDIGDFYALYAPEKLNAINKDPQMPYQQMGVWAFRTAWVLAFETALDAIALISPGLYDISERKLPSDRGNSEPVNALIIQPVVEDWFPLSHKFTEWFQNTPPVANNDYIERTWNLNVELLFDENDKPRYNVIAVTDKDLNFRHLCIERHQYATDFKSLKGIWETQVLRHPGGGTDL